MGVQKLNIVGLRTKFEHVRCISAVLGTNLFDDFQNLLKITLNTAIHRIIFSKKWASIGHLDAHLAKSYEPVQFLWKFIGNYCSGIFISWTS